MNKEKLIAELILLLAKQRVKRGTGPDGEVLIEPNYDAAYRARSYPARLQEGRNERD